MIGTLNRDIEWSFPFCPSPPDWTLSWNDIAANFPWIQAMAGVPQDPIYHAEGDVFIHTHMVAKALVALEEWRKLPHAERNILFAAALLHDVAKPICTAIEEDGSITSKNHARKGEKLARYLMWEGSELHTTIPFPFREHIANLVRFHGRPLWFLEQRIPEQALIETSQRVRMDMLSLVAEVDVKGRICRDQLQLLESVELFREFSKEINCYTSPWQFPSDHSRFIYFMNEPGNPDYEAYDNTQFEVVLMSGLPGAGKDTWIQQNLPDWSVISLDQIRRKLKISPEANQGQVIQTAKELARDHMRKHQSFVWNSTNVTRMMRRQLIDFFALYGARIRIVYLDASAEVVMKRNANRPDSVPEQVIHKLMNRLDVPDITEAHKVEWIY